MSNPSRRDVLSGISFGVGMAFVARDTRVIQAAAERVRADVIAKTDINLLFIPGYMHTPNQSWLVNALPDLRKNGINAEMVYVTPRDIPSIDEYKDSIGNALVRTPGSVRIATFSLGGGASQRFLEEADESIFLLPNGSKKIIETCFIDSRNLYGDAYNPEKVPAKFRGFYRRIDSPERAFSRVGDGGFRVAYGALEKDPNSVLPDECISLAASLRVSSKPFPVAHGGILDNPEYLLQVIK